MLLNDAENYWIMAMARTIDHCGVFALLR